MSEHEIKRRFRWALLGYAILAIACIGGIAYSFHQQSTLDTHQKAIEEELRGLQANQHAVVRLAAYGAAAICLQAFADDRGDVKLVMEFNHNGTISVRGNPACQQAVAKAKALVVPKEG